MEKDQSRVITPPPHPELQSRISALALRNQKRESSPREILPITKDAFRTGLTQELHTANYRMPEGEFDDQTDSRPAIFIGTGNAVKETILQAILSDVHGGTFQIFRVPGEENPRAIDSWKDAQTKAKDSYTKAQNQPEYVDDPAIQEALSHKSIVFAANDVLNKEPTVIDGQVVFNAVGKPDGETQEEKVNVVKNRFKNWAEIVDTYALTEFPYVIESTMYLHNPIKSEERDGYITKKAGVWLTPEIVKYLATEEGFHEYEQAVEAKGYDITQIAGGVDLLTIRDMKAGERDSVQGIFPDIKTMQTPNAPLSPEGMMNFAEALALGHASVAFEFIHDYCAKFPRINPHLDESERSLQDFAHVATQLRTTHRRDADLFL